MLSNIPITEARNELTSLPEKLAQQGGTLAITRRGKPVLAVMTWEHYEAILETIEILGDANLMANLHQGITEAKSAFLGDRDVLAVEGAIALKPKPNSMLGF